MKRIRWIDGAKGVAMLMVIAVHLSQKYFWLPGNIFSFGAMGVQLFFLMSGYCLCMKHSKNDGAEKWKVMKRYRRLAPWYLAGIAIYAAYYWLSGNYTALANYTPWNIASNVLMVNSLFPSAQNTIVPGGWSISCIALFSFAFPLFTTNDGRLSLWWLLAVSLIGIVLSMVGYMVLGWPRQYVYCSIMNQFAVFALGTVYFAAKPHFAERIGLIFAAGSAIGLFIMTVCAVLFDREHAILYRHVLVAMAFVFVLPLLERVDSHMPAWLVWIGRHSYEIFILHFLVIWLLPGS